jgi:hypothetical protein
MSELEQSKIGGTQPVWGRASALPPSFRSARNFASTGNTGDLVAGVRNFTSSGSAGDLVAGVNKNRVFNWSESRVSDSWLLTPDSCSRN